MRRNFFESSSKSKNRLLHNPPAISDEALLESIHKGAAFALNTLMERHKNRVFNVVAGFLPNRQDAEDVCQEVFLEIWRSAGQFRRESRASTWIYRVAVSKSLEALRYRSRVRRAGFFRRLAGLDEPEAQRLPSPNDLPGVALENRERMEILHRCLAMLPENQRVALVLQKMEGLHQNDIAETLGLSVGAVEGLLSRGKTKLRQILEAHYQHQEF